ncbi:hypothetical protein KQJ29_37720, partial [Enterococcus sp. S181_ASV_20]|nr:hypothetical protein [Enterococcus sp. S181_ASV_20]
PTSSAASDVYKRQELENLMPDYLEQLLFDDIPFLDQARREHDLFADTLRSKGIEVLSVSYTHLTLPTKL